MASPIFKFLLGIAAAAAVSFVLWKIFGGASKPPPLPSPPTGLTGRSGHNKSNAMVDGEEAMAVRVTTKKHSHLKVATKKKDHLMKTTRRKLPKAMS